MKEETNTPQENTTKLSESSYFYGDAVWSDYKRRTSWDTEQSQQVGRIAFLLNEDILEVIRRKQTQFVKELGEIIVASQSFCLGRDELTEDQLEGLYEVWSGEDHPLLMSQATAWVGRHIADILELSKQDGTCTILDFKDGEGLYMSFDSDRLRRQNAQLNDAPQIAELVRDKIKHLNEVYDYYFVNNVISGEDALENNIIVPELVGENKDTLFFKMQGDSGLSTFVMPASYNWEGILTDHMEGIYRAIAAFHEIPTHIIREVLTRDSSGNYTGIDACEHYEDDYALDSE